MSVAFSVTVDEESVLELTSVTSTVAVSDGFKPATVTLSVLVGVLVGAGGVGVKVILHVTPVAGSELL